MSIVNSNNFLHKTVDGVKQFFSPLVNAATVVRKDGTRLEQDGEVYADSTMDSAKLGGVEAAEYIQHSAALTLEEIEASDDLSGKVASAEAAGKLSKKGAYIKLEGSAASVTSETWTRLNKSVELTAGNWLFVCPFFRDQGGGSSVFKTYIAIRKNDTYSGDANLGALSTDWLSHSMGAYVLSVSEAGTYNVFVQHTSSTTHTIDIRSYFVRL